MFPAFIHVIIFLRREDLKMSSYIDLHMHTKYSDDGQFEPTKLVDMCKEAGVKIMAIADHNTVNAIPEAIKQAQKNGMKYIPAIEI